MRISQIIILVIGVVLLGILFFLFKPHPTTQTVTPQSSTAVKESTSSAKANIKTFQLEVKNNKLVSGPSVLTVTEGDSVDIRIKADIDGELHLHGYDRHINFKKDQPADLIFSADTTGRFPYELEDTKTEIGALEVLPK